MCQAIRELMEDARNEGLEQGIEQGISVLIESLQNVGISKEDISGKIREKFKLTEEKVILFMEKYWNNN